MRINLLQKFKQHFNEPSWTCKRMIGDTVIGGLLLGSTFLAAHSIGSNGGKIEQNKELYMQKHDSLVRAEEQARQAILMDSIAQANYAKGMQAVKDSISKANKK